MKAVSLVWASYVIRTECVIQWLLSEFLAQMGRESVTQFSSCSNNCIIRKIPSFQADEFGMDNVHWDVWILTFFFNEKEILLAWQTVGKNCANGVYFRGWDLAIEGRAVVLVSEHSVNQGLKYYGAIQPFKEFWKTWPVELRVFHCYNIFTLQDVGVTDTEA